jgi:response regulator RpfG family c-di-GMP phosphodiesterase
MSWTLGRSARILIAGDDREVRDLLRDLLGTVHECTVAEKAEEALGRLPGSRFDLVISDFTIDGECGLELIPCLRELAPDTLAIVISGVQSVESAVKALRAGAFDYIAKPFDATHLERAVARALEHQQLCASKRRYESFLEEIVEQRTAQLDRAVHSLENAYRMTLKALTASLEMRDHETHGHSERVVNVSLRLGRELGVVGEQLRSLEFGALLHDIGKIGVPDAILRKPSPLSEAEWTRMREHPLHGQTILRGVEFLSGASRVVAEHHERWDGSGYPLGLRNEEIDLNARIFAVADAFDAITSDRVYRRGRGHQEVLAELKLFSARQFDPLVVEAFLRVPREEWDDVRRRSLDVTGEPHIRPTIFDPAGAALFLKTGISALVN